MRLNREEVVHIARLARIQLNQEELERYQEQLSAILDYATRLQNVETNQVVPTTNVLNLTSRLRSDEPQPGLSRDELLRNAPQVENGRFRVPPILE